MSTLLFMLMRILRNVHITAGEHLMLVFVHSPNSRHSVKKQWIVSNCY